jgi:hypothetical protein
MSAAGSVDRGSRFLNGALAYLAVDSIDRSTIDRSRNIDAQNINRKCVHE